MVKEWNRKLGTKFIEEERMYEKIVNKYGGVKKIMMKIVWKMRNENGGAFLSNWWVRIVRERMKQ